jgi:hypothetical protein
MDKGDAVIIANAQNKKNFKAFKVTPIENHFVGGYIDLRTVCFREK